MSTHNEDAPRPQTKPIPKPKPSVQPKDREVQRVGKDENEDSTLNEGWEKDGLRQDFPKPVPPKAPEPRNKDAGADDAGDSSCV